MTDRARMEQLRVALEEARRVEKQLDRQDVDEDDRRSEEITVRFAGNDAPAPH